MAKKPKVRVRAAGEGDIDALARLNGVVQDLHATLYPDEFKGAVDPALMRRFFKARLADRDGRTMIAEDEGGPLGYIWSEIQHRRDTPFKPARSRIYVNHISVLPEARRKGVASALIAAVERQALAEGIEEIELDYWAANAEAEAFFTAQGFAPFNPRVRKRIKRPRQPRGKNQPPDKGEKKATS
jgi:ribosomal protein S18 acetylase RimI-like enzyme